MVLVDLNTFPIIPASFISSTTRENVCVSCMIFPRLLGEILNKKGRHHLQQLDALLVNVHVL